jgi:hypothetical protein
MTAKRRRCTAKGCVDGIIRLKFLGVRNCSICHGTGWIEVK